MRVKSIFAILVMYAAAALLLPVSPAGKMAGGHSRNSILRSLVVAIGPETVSAKSMDDGDNDLPVRAEEKIQKSFVMPATGQKSLEIDNIWG
ncbi:MAG: hypothetical protein WBE12_00330, partial [Candidatus Acidiferrum sp.]